MSHKGINFINEYDAGLKDFGEGEQGPHVLFAFTELTKRTKGCAWMCMDEWG